MSRFFQERMMELHDIFSALDQRKAELDDCRPLPAVTAASLREKLALEWTYHSNAIEGNTLTLRETKVVLEGITVGGKTLREHFEAINHQEAIQFVEDLVGKSADINEWNIRNIHQLVLRNIASNEAGRYRRENVVITGSSTIPPDHVRLPEVMAGLMAWYGADGQSLHPIERAAQLHTRFVGIHPFLDGNGRTGRLLLNFELMREGFPPVIIRKEDRLAYYNALDKACATRDYEDITQMVAEGIARSLGTYLEVVIGCKPDPLLDERAGDDHDGSP
ncbi:Fic family protein [Verminephrobacter aporrectodeae subsp. tuberculatae]|nr:Fic family protein [Verminephrobacter aporrectodeae subsp. tuberculatae]